jgi:hypothetical protein
LYSSGKQTYSQLAEQFGCSIKTIQRKLDTVVIEKRKVFSSKSIVIMDTTYFGRGFGVMIFKNSLDRIAIFDPKTQNASSHRVEKNHPKTDKINKVRIR